MDIEERVTPPQSDESQVAFSLIVYLYLKGLMWPKCGRFQLHLKYVGVIWVSFFIVFSNNFYQSSLHDEA